MRDERTSRRCGTHALDVPQPRSADAAPVLAGREMRLRPVKQSDYPFLLDLQVEPDNLVRWRYRGTTPSPEQIVQTLWQSVLAQFVIARVDDDEPIGLIVCYNPDFRHGYAYLAMIILPRYEMTGWIFEAVALFLNYVFETFGFRKIYFEMLEFNYAKIASGAGSLFHVEACLRDHECHLGHRWHQYTLATYRDEWPATLARYYPHLVRCDDRVKPAHPRDYEPASTT